VVADLGDEGLAAGEGPTRGDEEFDTVACPAGRLAVDGDAVHREAPEIDGVIHLDLALASGEFVDVDIVDAMGPDLVGAGVDVGALETI